ncbi:MAG TPA: acetate--CoA ligase family protein [Terriglobales bacterium]|nr:acetate--CoA ligase family protein [Terriglobales bacterium]
MSNTPGVAKSRYCFFLAATEWCSLTEVNEALQRIFYPNSVVVIGVSERPENLARMIIDNLHNFHYNGKVFAVGRTKGIVHSIPITTSLDDVPDGLDLAVILTPAATVPGLMESCARKGIRCVVIESGGFSEFSEEGRQLEQRLLEIAGRWGMRFVGPNCISVINQEIGLCLPFPSISPTTARLGPASVISQSGGVSVTYLDLLCMAGVGVNKAVSIGNKADLNEVDYLAYLLKDPGTKIVCMYLESVSDGRELMEMARSSTKPIIVHKANRNQSSQQVALSHTAALADDDQVVSAAFHQAGIMRAEDFGEAVAIAQGLTLPPVRGNNLVVISRSGGHSVVAADAAERFGFLLAPLPDDFIKHVRGLIRTDVIALKNPIDLGLIFDFDLYGRIVEECLRMLSPDAVLLVNTYSLNEAEGAHRLARRVEEIVKESGRPIALCVYSQGVEKQKTQQETSIPVFAEIDDALRGLAASRDWNHWRTSHSDATSRPAPELCPVGAEQLLAGSGVLTADQALALCQTYRIPVAPFEVADDPAGAVKAADGLGYPVAIKALAKQLQHKSDVGGVLLELQDAVAVRREAAAMKAKIKQPIRLLVQRMVGSGLEVILGGKRDRSFGPVVMFGLGGIYVEVLGDVALRVAPLSQTDAKEMVDEVRGRRLLDGIRGQPPLDRKKLIEALLSVSRMLVDNPSIAEIDVNPLLVQEHGIVAVDARVVLGNGRMA